MKIHDKIHEVDFIHSRITKMILFGESKYFEQNLQNPVDEIGFFDIIIQYNLRNLFIMPR